MDSSKQRKTDLAKTVREAAMRGDLTAKAAISLIDSTAQAASSNLVRAIDHDSMLREQGAARELQRLLKELTTEPPTISKDTTE